jgi:hypothetical protein
VGVRVVLDTDSPSKLCLTIPSVSGHPEGTTMWGFLTWKVTHRFPIVIKRHAGVSPMKNDTF